MLQLVNWKLTHEIIKRKTENADSNNEGSYAKFWAPVKLLLE